MAFTDPELPSGNLMSSWKQLQPQPLGHANTGGLSRRAKDKDMAASGNRGGGRRSKGERSFVGTRVPVEQHEKLKEAAARENLSISEFVENLIASAVESPVHSGAGRKGAGRLTVSA